MKKIYVSPTCRTIDVDSQDILAASPGIGDGNSDPNRPGLSKRFAFDELDDEGYDD